MLKDKLKVYDENPFPSANNVVNVIEPLKVLLICLAILTYPTTGFIYVSGNSFYL